MFCEKKNLQQKLFANKCNKLKNTTTTTKKAATTLRFMQTD